jgi:hypothetical protein
MGLRRQTGNHLTQVNSPKDFAKQGRIITFCWQGTSPRPSFDNCTDPQSPIQFDLTWLPLAPPCPVVTVHLLSLQVVLGKAGSFCPFLHQSLTWLPSVPCWPQMSGTTCSHPRGCDYQEPFISHWWHICPCEKESLSDVILKDGKIDLKQSAFLKVLREDIFVKSQIILFDQRIFQFSSIVCFKIIYIKIVTGSPGKLILRDQSRWKGQREEKFALHLGWREWEALAQNLRR